MHLWPAGIVTFSNGTPNGIKDTAPMCTMLLLADLQVIARKIVEAVTF